MKVVFIKTVMGLGNIGDTKDVSNGHGLNYLIPQKIALPATGKNIELAKQLKSQKQQQKNKGELTRKNPLSRLNHYTLLLMEKADEQGTFFAGITVEKIARELQLKGFNIKAKQIKLEQPIKKSGVYSIIINLSLSEAVTIYVDARTNH